MNIFGMNIEQRHRFKRPHHRHVLVTQSQVSSFTPNSFIRESPVDIELFRNDFTNSESVDKNGLDV